MGRNPLIIASSIAVRNRTAVLDKSSDNPDAIRGQEQYQIEHNGGAQSQGGTSGNAINGVGPKNPNREKYE